MNIMKFLLLLILPIASISFGGAMLKCYKEEKLEKKGSFNATTSYTVLYLDNDFSGDCLYFEVTVYNGYFYYNDQIYYGFRNEIFGDEISSNNFVFLDSSTESYNSEKINYHDGVYDKLTAYYKIPRKEGYKYVYFYYPVFKGNYLIVKNVVSISGGAIAGIVLGSIAFLIILIAIICLIRIKRRKNNISYSSSGYSSKKAEYNYPNNAPMPSNYPPPSDFNSNFPPYQPNYSSTQPSYNSHELNKMAQPLPNISPSSGIN